MAYPRSSRFLTPCGAAICGWLFITVAAAANPPDWKGAGRFRVLVEVPPVGTVKSAEEMVAACELSLERLLADGGIEGSVDLASFQVQAYDPATGATEEGPKFRSARSPYDRPCRFEDDELPLDYPSRVGRASETTDGRPQMVIRPRKARLFNREMNSRAGRLIWSHHQEPEQTSHYAIYFDVSPTAQPWGVSPAPWIGDADVLREEQGQPLGGFSHFTATVGDLNGDGLFDVVAGTEKGDLFWFANRGEKGQPKFLGCQILQDEQGPIDTGWYAAPVLYDWDGDGKLDLLVGTSGNVILWWRGVGENDKPQFRYMGFVQADGKRLEVPESPVAEDDNAIFARDYFNQPWIGDFDGDGLPDIVTGGYTTGQIFWYRGTARNADGTPQLHYAGELTADGEPIDTAWAAAPACFDMNGDGHMDLVTGAWWWSGIPGTPPAGANDLLMLYQGTGNEAGDQFKKVPFPSTGNFPSGSIARPTVVDADGDGLLDLFVSDSGGNAYLMMNVGTAQAPSWDTQVKTLTLPWGFAREFDVAANMADLDGDGTPEWLMGNAVGSIGNGAASPEKKHLGTVHVNGKAIHHPGPGYGDPYYFSVFCQWDDDGRADILWGTHQGNIYLHRNLAAADRLAFDEGVLLRLVDGQPLRVGPPVVESPEQATDFTILQGSRIVFEFEDLDNDGTNDLLVGDTFANLWVFRGTKKHATDAFEPGILIAKLPTRPEAIACTDWNGDGKPDLLIGGTASEPAVVYYNNSEAGRPAIDAGVPISNLPYLFWGPKLRAADWNGDGDIDLLVQSEFFSFWIERSFLDHSYRMARIVSPIEEASADSSLGEKESR
ncbi:MAG: VCBS repeat-containing protein [Pirellulales bacterium]